MIVIIDFFGGLCNQFIDLNSSIAFCDKHNINFTVRYCTFRNDNLITWHNVPFDTLFDNSFLDKYKDLYVEHDTLELTPDNTVNWIGEPAFVLFKNQNVLEYIQNINKKHIVIRQGGAVLPGYDAHLCSQLSPSKRLMDIYNNLKSKLINSNEVYNFIHYRYESDFTNAFKVKITGLKQLIIDTMPKFKNPNLRIYIATTNIKTLMDFNETIFDKKISDIIVSKNDDDLQSLNFEEKAFIDFMFGRNSNEVFGHSNSSFSGMLNSIKNSNNYYA